MTVHDFHIRQYMDPVFNNLRETLQLAYTDWKKNIFHTWKKWDKAETTKKSHEQYLMLRSLLNCKYSLLFNKIADSIPLHNEVVKDDLTQEEVDANINRRRFILLNSDNYINSMKVQGIDLDLTEEENQVLQKLGLL